MQVCLDDRVLERASSLPTSATGRQPIYANASLKRTCKSVAGEVAEVSLREPSLCPNGFTLPLSRFYEGNRLRLDITSPNPFIAKRKGVEAPRRSLANFAARHANGPAGLRPSVFWVISRRKALVLSPRARLHKRTIGEAMKIEEYVPTITPTIIASERSHRR